MSEIRRHLEQILITRDFTLLEPFKESKGWINWPPKERELLAQALVEQGRETMLSSQSRSAHRQLNECFALALQIAPLNARIYWDQAKVLIKSHIVGKHSGDLLAAIQLLEKALNYSTPDLSCLISLELASALMKQSDYANNSTSTVRVEKLLNTCSDSISHDSQRAGEVLQMWGRHYLLLAEQSGEAWELRSSVEKFRAASELLVIKDRDWKSMCRALKKLGELTMQTSLYREAINSLRIQLSESQQSAELWSHMGQLSLKLYETTCLNSDYQYAERCFGNTALLAPERWQSWYCWGSLYVTAGKARQQISLLRFGLEKLTKALKLRPGKPQIASQIAECQLMMAIAEEDFQLMKHAQQCLDQCVETEPFEITHLFRKGMCQLAIARYFGDSQHLIKAYTFFQETEESLGPMPQLQIGLALCCSALAETALEPQLLQKAIEHFEKGKKLASCQVHLLIDWAAALMRFAEFCGQSKELIEKALVKLNQALQLCDHLEIGPTANLLFHFGCALDFMGDVTGEEALYEQSIHALTKAIQIDPDHYPARFNLAVVYSHIGESFDDAKSLLSAARHFQALARLDSEDELVWQEWGITLMHLAEASQEDDNIVDLPLLEEAEMKLHQALQLGALTPHYHLASIYSLRGQIDVALNYLERAIEEKTVPGIEEIEEDEWLDALRQAPRYIELMEKFKETLLREESGEPQGDAGDSAGN